MSSLPFLSFDEQVAKSYQYDSIFFNKVDRARVLSILHVGLGLCLVIC